MTYYMSDHRGWLIKSLIFHVLYRFLADILIVLMLQTSYNHAVLTYSKTRSTTYIGIISMEYDLRRIDCSFEKVGDWQTKLAALLW